MIHKLTLLGLTMLLLLGLVVPTAAQDFNCSELDEADCATLQNALDGIIAAGSFNNREFSITLGGGGGTSDGNQLALTGSGPMVIDEDRQIVAMDLKTTGGFNDDEPSSGRLILVDDMAYLGTAEDGELSWVGAPVLEGNAQVFSGIITGNLVIEGLQTPNAVTIRRLADQERDGITLQTFEADVDLVAFIGSDAILGTIQALLQNNELPEGAVPEDNPLGDIGSLNQADLRGALQLIPLLLERDTVRLTVLVNDETGAVDSLIFELDLILNAAIIDPTVESIALNFVFDTQIDQIGEAMEIIAPTEYEEADVTEFNLDMLPIGDILGGGGAPAETVSDADLYVVEATLAYGETVSGVLSDDNIFDVWGFEAEAGDVVTITMKAASEGSSLDTRIFLRDPEGAELAFNDDHLGGEGLAIFDSQIVEFEIPADGEYRIQATWLTETRDGDYELVVEKVN